MPRLRLFLLVSLMLLVTAFAIAQDSETKSIRVASPNEQIVLILSSGAAQPEPAAGPPRPIVDSLRYAVEFHGKRLFEDSALGLKLEGQSPLGPGMRQVSEQKGSDDETYAIPVGKTSTVRDHYNSARAILRMRRGASSPWRCAPTTMALPSATLFPNSLHQSRCTSSTSSPNSATARMRRCIR